MLGKIFPLETLWIDLEAQTKEMIDNGRLERGAIE